ncbi:MAG: hypothetical protein IT372_07255 [Polyangiaceae bacterium]|nr:hypothetical protein [Polyangiaceae bacterium]
MKIIAIALLAAASLSAATAAAEEPAPPPPRYPPSSVRPRLIAGGLVVTGLAYGAGFLAASSWPEVPGSSELKIPVVGPWMALAKNDCAPDDPDCGFILYMRGFLTIIDGLMQLGGLGIAGEGVFMTTEASSTPEARPAAIRVRPTPIVAASGAGLGVVGTF